MPNAADTQMPAVWLKNPLLASKKHIHDNKEVTAARESLNVGHLITGLDSDNCPTEVKAPHLSFFVLMEDLKEATTCNGDLGSVVCWCIQNSPNSLYATACEHNEEHIKTTHNDNLSMADMNGNADANGILNTSCLIEHMHKCYAATTGDVNQRCTKFADKIGLRKLKGNKFSGDTLELWGHLEKEAFQAATLVALAEKDVAMVELIYTDKPALIPGCCWICSVTFPFTHLTVLKWVVNHFINFMVTQVKAKS